MRNGAELTSGRRRSGARLRKPARAKVKGTGRPSQENVTAVGNGTLGKELPVVGKGLNWEVLQLWKTRACSQVLPQYEEGKGKNGKGSWSKRKGGAREVIYEEEEEWDEFDESSQEFG